MNDFIPSVCDVRDSTWLIVLMDSRADNTGLALDWINDECRALAGRIIAASMRDIC